VKKVDKPDYTVLFACVAGLMVVSVVILLLTIKENRMREEMIAQEAALGAEEAKIAEVAEKAEAAPAEEAEATEAEAAPAAEAKEENKLAPEVKKSMYFILFSVFFWYMAYNAVSSTFSVYAEEMWGMKGGSFAGCLTVATAAAIISFVPLGFISAKFGRKKTIMAGVLVMAACFSVAIFVTAYHPLVNIIFASIGIGWAAINVNSYPMIMAMSKGSDVGKFTGTYYTFSMAAQILTPILSGFFLEYVSNRSLFVYALIFSLVAFLTMSFVKHGDVKPEKKESLLENFDVED
jgi:Na+/melibiose symporter-like transporter